MERKDLSCLHCLFVRNYASSCSYVWILLQYCKLKDLNYLLKTHSLSLCCNKIFVFKASYVFADLLDFPVIIIDSVGDGGVLTLLPCTIYRQRCHGVVRWYHGLCFGKNLRGGSVIWWNSMNRCELAILWLRTILVNQYSIPLKKLWTLTGSYCYCCYRQWRHSWEILDAEK